LRDGGPRLVGAAATVEVRRAETKGTSKDWRYIAIYRWRGMN